MKQWLADPQNQALLTTTARPVDINPMDFHSNYFTGVHGAMRDFPNNSELRQITRDIHECGGVVSSVCHGYCGLLNTRLSDGNLLVAGRRLTGYACSEEVLAGIAKDVPYNAEQAMKDRGALYEKALLPFVSNVVVDGRLVTCQKPGLCQSHRKTGRSVALTKF